MEFRDLGKQYKILEDEIKEKVNMVMESGIYIGGECVKRLEAKLADYVGVKHCITCANGTDALVLALSAIGIEKGDAVFVPDFTFFATGEAVLRCNGVPIFVDVSKTTYNMLPESLESAILNVTKEKKIKPKAIIAVDLFGQPADYRKIIQIASKYGLKIIEDGAQGFGGRIGNQKVGSFGDISTTSFFPAKPLGCYGDGGAIFTDEDVYATIIKSLCVHGKGKNKYDNVRMGMNSRLDSIQAAILEVKFEQFRRFELEKSNTIAEYYNDLLDGYVGLPEILPHFFSSWAQYTIQCGSKEERLKIQVELEKKNIPSMIYYNKAMHEQQAFNDFKKNYVDCKNAKFLTRHVLSLPFHPYMTENEIKYVADTVINVVGKNKR